MTSSIHTVALKIRESIDSLPVLPTSVIVYDIDGTLIDNYNNPIAPIVSTYQYAKAKGFKTVIITARPDMDHNIHLTRDNLRSHGITGYSKMYFLPTRKRDQAKFKLLARKSLHDDGNTVVMSIGDMLWDVGAFGGRGFIVPQN